MSKKTTLILELQKIQRLVNSTLVLDIRHLKFHKGTIYGVVGSVGSGKTSLLSVLSGFSKPNKGSILYDYKPYKKNLFGVINPPQEMLFVNHHRFKNKNVSALFEKSNGSQILSNYFSNSSVDTIMNTKIDRLSNGEKSAVSLALSIELDPRVLVIDDYAMHYDNKMENKFRKKLKNINKDHGTTLILSSANEQTLRSFCSVLIYLDNGYISKIRTGTQKTKPYSRNLSKGYQNNKSKRTRSSYKGNNDKSR